MTRSTDGGARGHGVRGRRRRSVAMLSHSYYVEDPRVRREAEALVRRGRPVDVFALSRDGEAPEETVDGVCVIRLPVRRHQGAGVGTYLLEYADFLVRAAVALAARHPRRRYGVVQVHTLPDYLVLAALPLRLTGVPVLLDLHEAMPEFFRSRFPRLANRAVYTLLRLVERASIALADETLTVNDALRDRLVRLGISPERVTVVLNAPDLARFRPEAHAERPFMADGELRLVYAGAVTPIYELDVVVRAVARLVCGADGEPAVPWPVRLDVFGRGDSVEPLRRLAAALGVAGCVRLHGRIPIEEVAGRIAASDAGLAPTRRDAFTDFSLSTKIFEYAAMRKPAVCSRLPTVELYFGDAVLTYEPGNDASLAAAIRRLVDEPELRERLVADAAASVAEQSWPREADRYAALVDRVSLP